ncbi:MAG: ArsB/NhaD family transporter [Halanaerobium sp.]|nr:ArsB/NhaD family transporter [Halanaerobium sp.]
MDEAWIAICIFALTYILIISERVSKTTAAMMGAVMMVLLRIMEQHDAFSFIDFNTIGLLIGMMTIVAITKRTGIFQFMAVKTARAAGGDPWKILVGFSLITALASALLDNVTTVLLMVPITLVVTDTLEVNPKPFLISEIIMANIGGTATLIGDPPNIMIGSATRFGFLDFIINLTPVVIIIMAVVLLVLRFIFKKDLKYNPESQEKIRKMDEQKILDDKKLLVRSLVVLGITLVSFLLHKTLGLESATVALFGAGLLLLWSGVDPEEVMDDIEWATIFFFAGLFVIVGGLEVTGVIDKLAVAVINFTRGNMVLMAIGVLWVSAIASTVIDNIPFVATMIPLIHSFGELGVSHDLAPIWWALALGACLGGNGSLVGASANVVVAGVAERHNEPISFVEYLKYGLPIMGLTIVISMAYLYLRYL